MVNLKVGNSPLQKEFQLVDPSTEAENSSPSSHSQTQGNKHNNNSKYKSIHYVLSPVPSPSHAFAPFSYDVGSVILHFAEGG